jgi:hypothetical protein
VATPSSSGADATQRPRQVQSVKRSTLTRGDGGQIAGSTQKDDWDSEHPGLLIAAGSKAADAFRPATEDERVLGAAAGRVFSGLPQFSCRSFGRCTPVWPAGFARPACARRSGQGSDISSFGEAGPPANVGQPCLTSAQAGAGLPA